MRKRDPRLFRPFVKLAADGSIAAVVEVAGAAPTDGAGSLYVDVSAFGPVDVETHLGVRAAIAVAITAEQARLAPPSVDPLPVETPPVNMTGLGLGVITVGG